jgi:hypothetical protein
MKEHIQAIKTIRSEEWKKRFLSLLSIFEELRAHLHEINHSLLSGSYLNLEPLVTKIITQYKREELVAARQYYNNSHLIDFWKWYNKELEKLIQSGKINSEFPVFSVTSANQSGALNIKSYDLDYFK